MRKQPASMELRVPAQQVLALSSVNMAPYNPRYMPPERMLSLKASLTKHGMVLNLVVQRRSKAYGDMVLIGGHQRVVAMRELCRENGWQEPGKIPAVVLDVADAEAKQLNVALNNIEGQFDPYLLGKLFGEVRFGMSDDDVLATGFARENIDELVLLARDPADQAAALEADVGELDGFGASITLSLEFATVEARDAAKALVRERAAALGEKAGDHVLRVLRADKAVDRARHNGAHARGDRRAGAGKAVGKHKGARGAVR